MNKRYNHNYKKHPTKKHNKSYSMKPITSNSYGSKAYINKHDPMKQIFLTVVGVMIALGFSAFWIGLVINYWLIILIGSLSIGLGILLIVNKSVKAHRKYSLKKY